MEVVMTFEEKCAVCGRAAPSSIADADSGSSPMVEEGWIQFVGEDELIIDLPQAASILPLEVVEAIRAFGGLIRVDPGVLTKAPATREVQSDYGSLVCPDCVGEPARAGWDNYQWSWFVSGLPRARPYPDGDE
jgi:hypothetical protein